MYDIADECDVRREVQRTMKICLTSPKELPMAAAMNETNNESRRGKFREDERPIERYLDQTVEITYV